MGANIFQWERGDDGVVILTMNDPTQSANTMNAAYVSSMTAAVDRLESERSSVSGVILTSAKKTFFAGADLEDLLAVQREQAGELFALAQQIKADLRRLERLGLPTVAAINGAALGGGLEIALACHHRVALLAKGSQIGLPEVTLGLLPGCGGVTRSVRLLGVQQALADVLLQGQRYSPSQAVTVGLVDEVVDSPEQLITRAKKWIKDHPEPSQPWDLPGYKMPGGTPASPELAAILPALPARLRQQIKGAKVPAPIAILSAAVEGAQVDFDTASTIESRYLTELATGQVAKNMIQAFFFDMQHINAGGSRPVGEPRRTVGKVGVVGAGMMGAGIAYVCARAGMEVVLKDTSRELAERGKGYSVKLVERAVTRGNLIPDQGDELLASVLPTADVDDLAGADLVIEAVYEDPALKGSVFAEVDPIVPDAVIASNTSTLPISGLAQSVRRPEDFVGLHFFSPVDKMDLLEIVVGEKTSVATLAKAIDFAQQIRKTPIVVNDSRGFFTSRVIGKFLDEAVAMVGEGMPPASIEQAALQAGYPAGPLQLYDELTLTLPRKIREETKAATVADGLDWVEHGSEAVLDRMIDEFDRRGRSSGGGFYSYVEGRRTGLWEGLTEHFSKSGNGIPVEEMQERMLFAEAIDTVRCFEEGVLRSVPDANIGSILGIGFPPWTGGVIQYINGYPGGVPGFTARARQLEAKYGARFTLPGSLLARASSGQKFE